jgi:hypothetical protein
MLGADLQCDTVELLSIMEGGLPEVGGRAMDTTPAAAEAVLVERTMGELG